MQIRVKEFEVVSWMVCSQWAGVHADGKFADLSPAFERVRACTEAHCRVEVEDGCRVDGKEREFRQIGQRSALNGNAERDESVVNYGAAEAMSCVLIWSVYLEVNELWKSGEGTDEGGGVGGGMKERWVLLHEEVCHLPAPVSRYTEACGGVAGWLAIRLVNERHFFTSDRVEQRWKECFGTMRHVKADGANMVTNSIQSSHASRFGECAWSKGDGEFLKEYWRGSYSKIMTCQTKRAEVFFGEAG